MNANKPCVTARKGIYFSMRLELSSGIWQRRRCVSSAERPSRAELLFISPVRQLGLRPQSLMCCSLNFIYVLLIVFYAAPVAPHPKSKDGGDASPQSATSLFTFADMIFDTRSILSGWFIDLICQLSPHWDNALPETVTLQEQCLSNCYGWTKELKQRLR